MVENGDGALPLGNDNVRNRDDVVEAADVAQFPAAGAPRPRRPLAMSAVCLFCLASFFFVGFAVGLRVPHGSSPAVYKVPRPPDTTQRLRWVEPVMKWPKVSGGLGVGVGLGVGWKYRNRIRDACGACAAWVCGVPKTFGTWATGIGSWIAYKAGRLMDHVIEESSKFNDKVDTFNENFSSEARTFNKNFSSEASKFNDTIKWHGRGFLIICAGFLGVSVRYLAIINNRMVARPAAA